MLIQATTEWLRLNSKEKSDFLSDTLIPILKSHNEVKIRYFDSEAFCAEYSDIIMWETENTMEYQAVVEELRETKFWNNYFLIKTIIPAIENAFEIHYDKKVFSEFQQSQ